MKKNKKLAVVLAAFLLISASIVTVYAVGYNSSDDPLVALSYITDILKPQIDEKIDEVSGDVGSVSDKVADAEKELKKLQDKLAEAERKLTEAEKKIAEADNKINELQTSGGTDTPSSSSTAFEPVFIPYGKTVYASAPVEIILRSGSAIALSPFGDQGLADYTSAAELLNGYSLTRNHLNIIPRGNDGRGVLVTSDAGAYFMIRGEYTVEE